LWVGLLKCHDSIEAVCEKAGELKLWEAPDLAMNEHSEWIDKARESFHGAMILLKSNWVTDRKELANACTFYKWVV
jgi:hypothetical protein